MHVIETEQVGVRFIAQNESPRLIIVGFGMQREDRGNVYRKWTIDVDWHMRNLVSRPHLVQGVDDLLRATNGKRWDNQLAAALVGINDNTLQFFFAVGVSLVNAIPVGAFTN